MEFKKYKIKDIGNVVGGATPLTKDPSNYDGDISWITPNDLSHHNEVYISTGERNITPKGLKEIGNSLLPKGTVLFSSRAPIGYVAIAAKELCTNQGFKSVIPNTKIVHPEYLYYTFKIYKSHIEKRGAGTTFMEVSGSTMESIELPFPSLDDQIKIADVLLKIDQKISLNTRMNAELEAMAKQLYDYWFVQFDFPDENGNPYKSSGGEMVYNSTLKREIPAGWEVENLYNLCLINRETISKNDNIETIAYLDTSNLTENRITDFIVYSRENAPSRAQRKVMDGTLLFSTVRPSQKHYGIIHNPPKNLIVSTGFATLDTIYHKDLYRIYEFLTSDATISYLSKLADTAMSSYPSINPSDIGELIITKPQTDLIDKYYYMVANSFLTIDKNIKEIKKLTNLRDSLLPMLMNGQVTVDE